ncbi:hypothetical protein GCM10010413_33660 [Promicromonospora sukumoe]
MAPRNNAVVSWFAPGEGALGTGCVTAGRREGMRKAPREGERNAARERTAWCDLGLPDLT